MAIIVVIPLSSCSDGDDDIINIQLESLSNGDGDNEERNDKHGAKREDE